MLVNLSRKDQDSTDKISAEVGDIFNLKARQALQGSVSGKLEITAQSIDIHNLLIFNHGINTCTIELRPDGIIIRFQVGLDTYGLVMPYYKLKVYKGQAEEYALHRDHYYIKVKANRPEIHHFIKKIRHQKADHWSSKGLWP